MAGITKAARLASAQLASQARADGTASCEMRGQRRQEAMRALRDQGCIIGDIARVFEVSTETVRRELRGDVLMFVSPVERAMIQQLREHPRATAGPGPACEWAEAPCGFRAVWRVRIGTRDSDAQLACDAHLHHTCSAMLHSENRDAARITLELL